MILTLIFHLFVFLSLIFIIVQKRKGEIQTEQHQLVFTKEWSFMSKGILAILIVLHHIATHLRIWYPEDSSWAILLFRQLIPISPILVGLFFFISGYGVMASYQKTQGSYLKTFVRKRLGKILPPLIVISLLCLLIVKFWLDPNYNVWEGFFAYVTQGKSFVIGWFIPVLILFYLIWYMVFKISSNKHLAISLLFILVIALNLLFYMNDFGVHWWASNLCFPFGVLYASEEYRLSCLTRKQQFLFFIALNMLVIIITFVGAIGFVRYPQRILPVLYSILFVWYTYLTQIGIKGKILPFLSTISYELFLVHIVVIRIADTYVPLYPAPLYMTVPIVLLISILLSWIFNKTFKMIKL